MTLGKGLVQSACIFEEDDNVNDSTKSPWSTMSGKLSKQ